MNQDHVEFVSHLSICFDVIDYCLLQFIQLRNRRFEPDVHRNVDHVIPASLEIDDSCF